MNAHNESLQHLKKAVIELVCQPSFKHHQRYLDYHLLIVQDICQKLLLIYSQADSGIVDALVWIHDYNKICGLDDQTGFDQGKQLLQECGYEEQIIQTIMDDRTLFEKKMDIDLHQAAIEVQIVSSADAMSHYVGPFFALYRYENPHVHIGDLMSGNLKKRNKDLRKVTLPEVKAYFTTIEQQFKQQHCGQYFDQIESLIM